MMACQSRCLPRKELTVSVRAIKDSLGLGKLDAVLDSDPIANYNCTLEHDCEDEPYLKKLIIAPSSSEVQEAMIISLQELGWKLRLTSLVELHLSFVSWVSHGYLQLTVLRNLQRLSITHSALAGLPSSIGSLKHLRSLDLSNNNLRSLPLTVSFCQNIELLNLQNNSFIRFPPHILRLQGLVTLRRIGNNDKARTSAAAVEKVGPCSPTQTRGPLSLVECCAQAVFTEKIDYWNSVVVGKTQRGMLDEMACSSHLCEGCSRLLPDRPDVHKLCVNVVLPTFNSVPFSFFTCGVKCHSDVYHSYTAMRNELDATYEREAAHQAMEDGQIEPLPSRKYSYTYIPHVPDVPGRFRVETRTENQCLVM